MNAAYVIAKHSPDNFRRWNLKNANIIHKIIGMSNKERIRYFTAASPKLITSDSSLNSLIRDDTSQGKPKHIKIPIELVPNELARPVPAWP